jgi:site-specific DNA recombinase
MNLIGYVRVSTLGQSENTSFESQERAINQYCQYRSHTLIKIVKETHTAGGGKQRPLFQRALKEVLENKADGLVVTRLDRFARSALEGLQVAALLSEVKKHLAVVELDLDTSTPFGKCIFTTLLAFAEVERELIQKRISEGRQRVSEAGYYSGGRPPFGWYVDGTHGKRRLVPHHEQQRLLARCLQMRKAGLSFNVITRFLNCSQIPSPNGGKWNDSTVWDLLHRPGKLIENRMVPDMVTD